MKPITTFEVYQVKFDHWALCKRLASREEDKAIEAGRALEASTGMPVQVIEETEDQETGGVSLRVIRRFGKAGPEVKGPPENTDIASRIVMVVINAIGIGAIFTVIAMIALQPLKSAGAAPGAYNMLLFFIFAASMLASALLLFKIYVPIELVLWRGKTPEARARCTEALLHGSARSEAPARPMRPPFRETLPPGQTEPAPPSDPGQLQTSFQIAELQQEPAQPAADAPPPAWPPEIEAAREVARNTLFVFADAALGLLALSRPGMQAFERFGLNLYLGGAAIKACEMTAAAGVSLPPEVRRELLARTLERAGTNAATVQSFVERLEPSLGRPRYKALADAGAEAFAAPPGEDGKPKHEKLDALLREWSDPAARGAKSEAVIFLLTDIVGSTALTAKLGNSAAQRVVRAHNTVARAAVKEFRGREIKHTGDGMLLTFPDAVTAARAAIAIQQDAHTYAADNPEAPLSLRVGLHTGQAAADEGGYHGEAVLLLDGICAAGEAGQITCSEEIAARTGGSNLLFVDLGQKLLKGTESERRVLKVEWTPKVKPPGPLEYRQIGAQTGS